MNKKFLIASLVYLAGFSFAQKEKADKLYADGQYAKAIPKYEKVCNKSGSDQQDACIKLGDCYRVLNEYKKAEEAYRKALTLKGNIPLEFRYNYGNILKSNKNYTEAISQFYAYLEEKPNEVKAKNAVKSLQEIKYWMRKAIEYQVKNVDGINTEKSEYCPAILNKKLVYVCEKQADLIEPGYSEVDGNPYTDVFIANVDGARASKRKIFSGKVNSPYDDGPVSFSADGKTMVFTRVANKVDKKNKDFVNRAKIYFADGNGGSNWDNIREFAYNSDKYSVAHPCLSSDGTTLFFTSDMPGGQGGKDLWYSKKNGNDWSKPVNLGVDINTSGDEMFPYFKSNGLLYFSSNGLAGFGGLDIFSAKEKEGKWVMSRNESMYLNSSADDFGICFIDDTTGYFSSNREGGVGKDDIYWFKYTSKYITVDGQVLLTDNVKDPAKSVKVYLTSATDNKILDSTKTNDKGYFAFRNLDNDKKYLAVIDPDDVTMQGKARFYLANNNGVVSRVTNKVGNEKFVFRNLPLEANGLPDLYTEDELTLAGNLLYGENPSKPIKNSKIIVTNTHGDVIETATTNEFGAFAFRNLPSDQNYMISIDETDISLPANTKITLTNKSGKEIKSFFTQANGKFKFNVLSSEKSMLSDLDVEDKDLIMELDGFVYDQDKQPFADAKLRLYGANGEVLQIIQTNAKGKFSFRNLKATGEYLFDLDENDPRMKNIKKLFIADAKGRVYKELIKNAKGKFEFKVLSADKSAMGEFSVDDPWLQVLDMKNKAKKDSALTIVENIYYATGEFKFDAAGQKVLDKVIGVLIASPNIMIELSSHTDSKSSDEFNMALSQKRAKTAVDYILSKGVDKKRLKAIGYGETRLLNKCANGVECTDEEHGKNRRTEFKIIEMSKS